eukprot:394997-Prorocentrum_minimum.AAC.1
MAVSLGAMQPDQAEAMVDALATMEPDQAATMVGALSAMQPDQAAVMADSLRAASLTRRQSPGQRSQRRVKTHGYNASMRNKVYARLAAA